MFLDGLEAPFSSILSSASLEDATPTAAHRCMFPTWSVTWNQQIFIKWDAKITCCNWFWIVEPQTFAEPIWSVGFLVSNYLTYMSGRCLAPRFGFGWSSKCYIQGDTRVTFVSPCMYCSRHHIFSRCRIGEPNTAKHEGKMVWDKKSTVQTVCLGAL